MQNDKLFISFLALRIVYSPLNCKRTYADLWSERNCITMKSYTFSQTNEPMETVQIASYQQ